MIIGESKKTNKTKNFLFSFSKFLLTYDKTERRWRIGGYKRQCVENKERLTLRIHRGWSKKPPAALTSVLLAKHGCPPGLGPALAGLAGRDIVTHIKSTTSAAVTGGDVENRRLDLPQITVTAAAASTIVTDCDLCRNGEQDRLYQHQQMHQQQQSSSGLRENVSNASPAYKVLYMGTPLCSCGRINASNGRAFKLGKKQTQRHWKSSKRVAVTERRTTGRTVVIDVWDRVPGAADLDWPTETMESILQDRPTATFGARFYT